MAEWIDVYDKKRTLINKVVDRKSYVLQEDEYMIYVLALIENLNHKFLVTQRVMSKSWAPGAWEIPGGAIDQGETSFDGVCREVKEETGLDVSDLKRDPIYSYRDDEAHYFVDVYRFILDFDLKDVDYQESEAMGVDVLDLDQIKSTKDFLHKKRICMALGDE